MRSYCLVDTEFLFRMMNKFWKWIVVTVTQNCEHTQHNWIIHFKIIQMVTFILCNFCNKSYKKIFLKTGSEIVTRNMEEDHSPRMKISLLVHTGTTHESFFTHTQHDLPVWGSPHASGSLELPSTILVPFSTHPFPQTTHWSFPFLYFCLFQNVK